MRGLGEMLSSFDTWKCTSEYHSQAHQPDQTGKGIEDTQVQGKIVQDFAVNPQVSRNFETVTIMD